MPYVDLLLAGVLLLFAMRMHQRLAHELHMLQLNSYHILRYLRWLRTNILSYFGISAFLPFLSTAAILFSPLVGIVCWGGTFVLLFATQPKAEAKKKLEFTPRATRLHVTNLIITTAIAYGLWVLVSPNLFYLALGLSIAHVLVFIVAILGAAAVYPIEACVNRWYVEDARKRIRQSSDLVIIGITGSYGKTSTKFILASVLSEEKTCLITPASYNTTMGVTKVIRTMLGPLHEVFIVEMGARQPGDIQEICSLVQPRIGIITAIGDQHLETFGSREVIQKTKFELIASLPSNGLACLNGDDPAVVNAANSITHVRKVFYGIEASGLDYQAERIKTDASGTSFQVRTPSGDSVNIRSHLLGRHNVLNTLGAVAVAKELGITADRIESGVRKVKPLPHRLEIMKIPGSYTIIDDAFSSNPVGAQTALEVLSEISGRRKIIVTPGMVELGQKEKGHNFAFGTRIAKVCDYVILVGSKQTEPIRHGLNSVGYPTERLHVADDLKSASAHLQTIVQKEDVVLFENDLPDNYNESKAKR